MLRIGRSNTTRTPRSLPQFALAALVAVALLLGASAAHACERDRYDAAAKYTMCDSRAFGRLFDGGNIDFFENMVSRCRVIYTNTWAKLQSQCGGDRLVDNGDGTVTDNLTGLQWEQKTADGSIHDQNHRYTWSAAVTSADGTVFTSFLATLNSGSCFAGHCDWRLPTRPELQVILLERYPCTTSPCIDQDRFGPTSAGFYWSSTTNPTGTGFVWGVHFADGAVSANVKSLDGYVRAVRGGL